MKKGRNQNGVNSGSTEENERITNQQAGFALGYVYASVKETINTGIAQAGSAISGPEFTARVAELLRGEARRGLLYSPERLPQVRREAANGHALPASEEKVHVRSRGSKTLRARMWYRANYGKDPAARRKALEWFEKRAARGGAWTPVRRKQAAKRMKRLNARGTRWTPARRKEAAKRNIARSKKEYAHRQEARLRKLAA